jgi:hypothetical protein
VWWFSAYYSSTLDNLSAEFESSGCGVFHTTDEKLFCWLKRLAGWPDYFTAKESDIAETQVGEKEPLFQEIKAMLAEAEVEMQQGFLTRETVGKRCPIYLDEPFTSKELAKSEYLRIIDVQPEMGDYRRPELPDNPPLEKALGPNEILAWCWEKQFKRNSPVGALEGSTSKSFVWLSDSAVTIAENVGLKLKINPVRWIYADEKKMEFRPLSRGGGWLGADLEMPKCLTPFKWLHGPNVGELAPADITDVYPERTWDGAGRMEPILKFRRSEVAKLGEFDVAHTLEKSRKSPAAGCYLPELIVSQRFRQWVSKNHYKIRFAPVELVDE